MRTRLASLLLALAGLSCASIGGKNDPVGVLDRESAVRHLDQARADVERGELELALERLLAVRRTASLVPEDRAVAEELLDRTVERLIERDRSADDAADRLEWLFEQELPTRLRARAGVLAAEEKLEKGERVGAFKMIKRVERALPAHPERALAGDLLARTGFSLAADPGRYLLFLSYRSRGIEALEYLVVNYPFDPRCDQAYATLAELYRERDDLDAAIARAEDLLVFHPESPYAASAEAHLPYLRLLRLQRDDYDRGELVLAREELDRWLERHPGHELEAWVREVRAECLQRLARSDLVVARFYERIESPWGARLHAERALEEARTGGADQELREAEELLADLPEVEPGSRVRARPIPDEVPSEIEEP
jgi:outer membrane protein assembly factor BamD (BamD/ComL family)